MQRALVLLAVATAALAAALPAPAPAPRALDTAQCICPWAGKEFGENIAHGDDWYQCAYTAGACTWDVVRAPAFFLLPRVPGAERRTRYSALLDGPAAEREAGELCGVRELRHRRAGLSQR